MKQEITIGGGAMERILSTRLKKVALFLDSFGDDDPLIEHMTISNAIQYIDRMRESKLADIENAKAIVIYWEKQSNTTHAMTQLNSEFVNLKALENELRILEDAKEVLEAIPSRVKSRNLTINEWIIEQGSKIIRIEQ